MNTKSNIIIVVNLKKKNNNNNKLNNIWFSDGIIFARDDQQIKNKLFKVIIFKITYRCF